MANPGPNTLCFKPDCTIYAGRLVDTKFHTHGAVALILALGQHIEIQFRDGTSIRSRSALLDAGVEHRLITAGEPVAIIYLEHFSYEVQRLRHRYLQQDKAIFDLIPVSMSTKSAFLSILNSEFTSLLGAKPSEGVLKLDARVQFLFEKMLNEKHIDFQLFPNKFTQEFGLSASRFRHMFKAETGISVNHFRQWLKALGFMRTLTQPISLTHHALVHGYSDSSHFANSYQKLLGITPSKFIRSLDEINVRRDLITL